MKVVIIPTADLLYNSGSVIYAKKLFTYLLDNGHEVYMLGSCMPNDIKQIYQKYIKIKENLLFHPIIDDRYVSDIQYFRMYTDILEALIDIYNEWGEIDIIHAHYASINSYAALQVKYMLNIPFVISSFGRDINIGYFSDVRIRNFIKRSFENVDKIIVPEINLLKKIYKLFPKFKTEQIEISPMPLDSRIFEKGNLTINKTKKKIIATINSCFTSEKGIETVILAFKEIREKYDSVLYIAGQDDDIEQINYKRLKTLVKDLEITKDVIFTGYLSRENVGKLLEFTDVFVDAREKGNFSSVLLEAQFKNKVILSSDNEAAKKIITNNINGMLFKTRDYTELAEKITLLFEDEVKMNKLIEGTKAWCDKHGKEYQEEICMKKIVNVYQDVVKK